MGLCFSSDSTYSSRNQPTAKVISMDGNLLQYPVPITVSDVLEFDKSSCFLCNSDCLFFDEYIPALDSSEELQSGLIYFVLPTTRLQYRVTAPDMAALAIKASTALAQNFRKSNNGRRSKNSRVSPVLESNKNQSIGIGGFVGYYESDGFKTSDAKSKIGRSARSGSLKKSKKKSSRRNKIYVQSFRTRLSTIYEEDEVDSF